MAEQLDLDTFTGAHPTNGEFVAQLRGWGFTQRRAEGVHLVFRGPHGGTLRVLRSLLGRADAAMVAKAARLAGLDVEQFCAGPDAAPAPVVGVEAPALGGDRPAAPPDPELSATAGARPRRRDPAPRDRIVSMVLAAHTSTDRPLGFEQVVALCRGRISRAQVQSASATLCRDGDLDRIRPGVYQWSAGSRAIPTVTIPSPVRPAGAARAVPPPRRSHDRRTSAAATSPAVEHPRAVELFEQLFPAGVRMTGELLADFEHWAQLTEKLAAYANAS